MMEAQRERRTPLRCATHKHRQEHWPVLGGARVTLMLQRARRRHDRHRKRASRGSQLGVAAAVVLQPQGGSPRARRNGRESTDEKKRRRPWTSPALRVAPARRTPCTWCAVCHARRCRRRRTPCSWNAAARARRPGCHRTPCRRSDAARARRCWRRRTPCSGWLRRLPCSQMELPPHCLQRQRSRPCGHSFFLRTMGKSASKRPRGLLHETQSAL